MQLTGRWDDPDPYRVQQLSRDELQKIRRQLAASLVLTRTGSPARAPIQAYLTAIDTELARQDPHGRTGALAAD
jgi:hypothetical protein